MQITCYDPGEVVREEIAHDFLSLLSAILLRRKLLSAGVDAEWAGFDVRQLLHSVEVCRDFVLNRNDGVCNFLEGDGI